MFCLVLKTAENVDEPTLVDGETTLRTTESKFDDNIFTGTFMITETPISREAEEEDFDENSEIK
jgi:hypothetical protein